MQTTDVLLFILTIGLILTPTGDKEVEKKAVTKPDKEVIVEMNEEKVFCHKCNKEVERADEIDVTKLEWSWECPCGATGKAILQHKGIVDE